MGIVLKWAELSKGYYYGEFLQHKPGLGCEITGDTTEDEALGMLEKLLDKWHTKRTSGTPFESLKPDIVVHSNTQAPIIDRKWEQFEIDIDNSKSPEELEAFIRQYDPFPGKYLPLINKKRQELKQQTKDT